MLIASRIHQVRLEHFLSREDLAAKAGLSKSLLASFENGQDVPSLEMFDRLADAVGVPIESFFYDHMNSNLTPYLTPRVSLQQLVDAPPRSASAAIGSLLNPRTLRSATQRFLSFVTAGDRRRMGNILKPSIPTSHPPARKAAVAREDANGGKRKS